MTWAAVSVADKADTVASLFAAGEKPTGSRDPFGLRRNVHGLLRVLVDLPELTGVERPVTLGQVFGATPDAALTTFLVERLRYVLEQRGDQSQRHLPQCDDREPVLDFGKILATLRAALSLR